MTSIANTPPNKSNKKLNIETKADNNHAKLTFFAFWCVNALTTFQFGMLYVEALYRPIFSFLPITNQAIMLFAAVSGGVSALLVLDVAYKRWRFIKLNCCQTAEQYKAARSAESVSFVLSLAYTAIALATTVFTELIPVGLLTWIDWFGAVSFVSVCIYNLICWKTWADNEPAVREQETITTTMGQQLSEELAFREEVIKAALLEAKKNADSYKEEIAAELGQQWGAAMIAQLVGTQPAQQLPEIIITPSTEKEKPNPKAKRGNE